MEVVQGHHLLIEASIISYQETRATASTRMKRSLLLVIALFSGSASRTCDEFP